MGRMALGLLAWLFGFWFWLLFWLFGFNWLWLILVLVLVWVWVSWFCFGFGFSNQWLRVELCEHLGSVFDASIFNFAKNLNLEVETSITI